MKVRARSHACRSGAGAAAEYLAALDETAEPNADRKAPKVISPSDPSTARTAKAIKRVQFGCRLNYLSTSTKPLSSTWRVSMILLTISRLDMGLARCEATPARTYDEVEATKTMIDRIEQCFDLSQKARSRRRLWHGQVPGLARQGQEDHAAHPGARQERPQHGPFSRSDCRYKRRGYYICPNGEVLRANAASWGTHQEAREHYSACFAHLERLSDCSARSLDMVVDMVRALHFCAKRVERQCSWTAMNLFGQITGDSKCRYFSFAD
jgi:hypothetical protein